MIADTADLICVFGVYLRLKLQDEISNEVARHHCRMGSARRHLRRPDLSRGALSGDGPCGVARLFVGDPDVVSLGASDSRDDLARAQVLAYRRRLEDESACSLACILY